MIKTFELKIGSHQGCTCMHTQINVRTRVGSNQGSAGGARDRNVRTPVTRKVELPAGLVTTAPGSGAVPAASLNEPPGTAVDPCTIDVFVGARRNEYGGDEAPAASAMVPSPATPPPTPLSIPVPPQVAASAAFPVGRRCRTNASSIPAPKLADVPAT